MVFNVSRSAEIEVDAVGFSLYIRCELTVICTIRMQIW